MKITMITVYEGQDLSEHFAKWWASEKRFSQALADSFLAGTVTEIEKTRHPHMEIMATTTVRLEIEE